MGIKLKKLLFIVACFSFSGCASLSKTVYHDIDVGTSEEKVDALLGDPERFEASTAYPGARDYYYKKRGETCIITIKDGAVINTSCSTDPNRMTVLKFIATTLQGGGEAMSRSHRNEINVNVTPQPIKPVTCYSTTDTYGNTTTTCY